MKDKRKGRPLFIVAGAVAVLVVFSLLPWGDLTGNRIKDFNLFGDLFPAPVKATATETIDPELANALAELDTDAHAPDSLGTAYTEGPDSLLAVATAIPEQASIADDGTVIFEDYTPGQNGLDNFRAALSKASSRPVRIGVIGDSYIEGDIFTMHLREALQDRYGGSGVGYLPAFTELTGFRNSVRQNCSGWNQHEIRKNARESMKTLPGEYYTSDGTGKSSFKGVTNLAHLDTWNKTLVLAVAPSGGSVTLTDDNATETFALTPGDTLNALVLSGTTGSASLSATAGVDILGVYLDGGTGISVDNMSLRGNSGQTHRKLSLERAAQMRPYVDYDLIVVEYGINALSSQQTNYSGYGKIMEQTVARLRQCYPSADIIMMGIGDRAQKSGTEVKSVPTAANMVKAQRDAARNAGVMFWDTRQAMGGEDAAVVWRDKGLINADYIHLNGKGGRELSRLFVNALDHALKD